MSAHADVPLDCVSSEGTTSEEINTPSRKRHQRLFMYATARDGTSMSSLQAIFDQVPPYTRAHYTVAGVTHAIVVNLPPGASEGAPDTPRPHFLLRLLQDADIRELVVSAPDLAVLLAGCTPPIPIQRGWAIDTTGATGASGANTYAEG